MNVKELKKALGENLLKHGFARRGNAYCAEGDDVICAIGIQTSQFEEVCYVNIGFMIRQLHPSLESLRATDGDFRTRFLFASNGKIVERLDANAVSSEEQIEESVHKNVQNLIEGRLSIRGLKSLLADYPTLQYQTTLATKQLLGCE